MSQCVSLQDAIGRSSHPIRTAHASSGRVHADGLDTHVAALNNLSARTGGRRLLGLLGSVLRGRLAGSLAGVILVLILGLAGGLSNGLGVLLLLQKVSIYRYSPGLVY